MYETDLELMKENAIKNHRPYAVEVRSKNQLDRLDGVGLPSMCRSIIYEHFKLIDMYIDVTECMTMTGLDIDDIDELEKEGLFPPQKIFDYERPKWLLSEVLEWMYDPNYLIDLKIISQS